MGTSPARAFLIAALFFCILAVIPLWRVVFLGEAFVPAGMQRGIAPWGSQPTEAWDVLRWDGVAQFYPWRNYLYRNLRRGDVPLWNRHELLGTPFLGNSQSAVFYPVHWLLAPLGTLAAMGLSAWLHLVWAGLGMYVLLRRLGCSAGAGLFAGATFELSQWFVAWLQLPSVPMTASWIPWLLAAVLRLWGRPDFGAVVRVGVCGGMMVLAGHLQIAVYGLIAAALAVGHLAFWQRGSVPRGLACSVAGLAMAGMLAAVQFLPTYEMGKLSHRAASPTEEAYPFYVRLAMPGAQAGLISDPYFNGNPAYGSALASHPEEGAYSGEQPLPEYASFLGWVGLALAAYALVRFRVGGHVVGLFGGLAAFAWLIALGTPLNRLLYFGVPGWSATGSPARILCLSAVAIAVLAGFGWQRLNEDQKAAPKQRLAWGLCAMQILATVAIIVIAASYGTGVSAHGPILMLAAGLLTLGIGLSFFREPLGWMPLRPAILLLQIATLAPFAADFNTTAKASEVYPAFPGLELLRRATPYRVAIINDRWGMRDYPSEAVLPPNSALAYGFDEVGGYDSIILKQIKKDVLDALNGEDSAPQENGNMMFVKPGGMRSVLATLGVRYIVTREPIGDLPPLVLRSKPGESPAIYEIPHPMPLGLFDGEQSGMTPVEVSWRGPNVVVTEVSGAGTLGLKIPNAPGWRVFGDGKELGVPEQARDTPWVFAHATRSSDRIVARYEPATFRVGFFLSLIGLMVCVSAGVSSLAKR